MPSVHYYPIRLQKALPDGRWEELCFVLVVDEEMRTAVTTRTYNLLSITGSSQVPTRSTRFPPNADFVLPPVGTAILMRELMMMVGQRFASLGEEEEEKEKEESELAIPLRRWFEQAGTPLPRVEQVAEGVERAHDVESNSIIATDYPEEYLEEYPRGPPPSPDITATHLPIPPHPQWLGEPSLPPSAPRPRYVSKFFPQPDIRSLTIAERRVRTRLAGEPTAGQTVRFPPERINVALAEGFGRGTIPGLPL